MKVMGMFIVSLRGVNCRFLVSLRVFMTESQYFYPYKYRLGFIKKQTPSYCVGGLEHTKFECNNRLS